jgi:hypothetical protein
VLQIKLAAHKTKYTAEIFYSNKDSGSNTRNQKSHAQDTEIYFPSTKIIIQITSNLTRALVLGKNPK